MKIIAIYYIATSNYKNAFLNFLEGLQLFLPNLKKIVVLLTDGLEEYNGYKDFKNNIYIDRRYINHYPWPIITLYKHYLINENKIDCDYACYFNADIEIVKLINECEFDLTKINFTTHAAHNKGLIQHIGHHSEVNANKLSKYYNILFDPNNADKLYCQACFFLGQSDLFFDMCKEITDMVNHDMQNEFVFLRWHDEHYMNVWILQHNDICYIRPYVNCFYKNHTIFFKNCNLQNKVDKQ